jgi:hypothetical protein
MSMRLFGRKCLAMMRSIKFEMSSLVAGGNKPMHADKNIQDGVGATKSWSLSW